MDYIKLKNNASQENIYGIFEACAENQFFELQLYRLK